MGKKMIDETVEVGDYVRAYDYGCRDLTGNNACFVEGKVVDIIDDGDVVNGRYVVLVEKDVWTGKAMDVRVGSRVFPPRNGRTIQRTTMNRVEVLRKQ